jgi:hypothetical protein
MSLARTAFVRPTMRNSGLRRAATASLTLAAISSIGIMCSMPTWWCARLGTSWSSISIAEKPAASAMPTVRCMCMGSP